MKQGNATHRQQSPELVISMEPSAVSSSYALSRAALFSFKSVMRAASTDDDCVRWCQQAGLLCAQMRCPKCDRDMKLHIRSHRWRCSRKGCALERSVRTGSIFSDSKMAISDCVLLLLLWSSQTSVTVAAEWVEVSAPTVLEWFSLCRDICAREMQASDDNNNYSHDPQVCDNCDRALVLSCGAS